MSGSAPPWLSSSPIVPTITATGEDDQFSAEAQACSESSASPRTSESTTSASSRASHAPRASAVRAYTCAALNAISLA